MATTPLTAPGWAALDRHILARYPGQVPHQFTSQTAYDLASRSPLPAIHVLEGAGPPHWHYVGYGLSELFDKSSNRADLSGFGFELTARLVREPGQESPPAGPLRLLQGLGHYVLSEHAELDTGHCIDLGGPLWPGADDTQTGVVLVPDATLGQVDTPNGRLVFLQLVALTAAELDRVRTWDLDRKIGFAREAWPLGLMQPGRACLTADPGRKWVLRRWECGVLT